MKNNAACVWARGIVTIPAAIRKEVQLHDGDRVTFKVEGNRVILEKDVTPFDKFDGLISLPPEQVDASIAEMRRRRRRPKAVR